MPPSGPHAPAARTHEEHMPTKPLTKKVAAKPQRKTRAVRETANAAPPAAEAGGCAPDGYLVHSGKVTLRIDDEATAQAQAFELRKGGYPADVTPFWLATPPASAPEVSDATDADIEAWLERHDISHAIRGADARAAFEDAQSWHLTAALQEGKSHG